MQEVFMYQHIKAGETVENGFPNGYCTAPKSEGLYTLYELADDSNNHMGWKWEKE